MQVEQNTQFWLHFQMHIPNINIFTPWFKFYIQFVLICSIQNEQLMVHHQTGNEPLHVLMITWYNHAEMYY